MVSFLDFKKLSSVIVGLISNITEAPTKNSIPLDLIPQRIELKFLEKEVHIHDLELL